MRFKHLVDIRFPVADNRPGQQHAAGFPADHPRADHMVPYGKIVLGREMLFHHFPHSGIAGHHDIAHPAAVFRDVCPVLVEQFRTVKEPVPGVRVLLLSRPLRQRQRLVEPA